MWNGEDDPRFFVDPLEFDCPGCGEKLYSFADGESQCPECKRLVYVTVDNGEIIAVASAQPILSDNTEIFPTFLRDGDNIARLWFDGIVLRLSEGALQELVIRANNLGWHIEGIQKCARCGHTLGPGLCQTCREIQEIEDSESYDRRSAMFYGSY